MSLAPFDGAFFLSLGVACIALAAGSKRRGSHAYRLDRDYLVTNGPMFREAWFIEEVGAAETYEDLEDCLLDAADWLSPLALERLHEFARLRQTSGRLPTQHPDQFRLFA